MTSAPSLLISCHCGAARQAVTPRGGLSGSTQEINLCHCSACRHNTGLLCVSYAGIERPVSIEGLAEYRSTTTTISRFFCKTCGCHVFWRLLGSSADETRRTGETEWWAVATGVIIGESGGGSDGEGSEISMRYAKHINTAGTRDGGLSQFIRHIIVAEDSEPLAPSKEKLEDPRAEVELRPNSDEEGPGREEEEEEEEEEEKSREVLDAFCHCGTVRFHVTRPDAESELPRSNFPDLMIPYHTNSPRIQNPDDDKWWLRPRPDRRDGRAEKREPRRYLAGTCACRSCRLTSGFEIQAWAFIPRTNIFLHIRGGEATKATPLDFAALPPGVLASYESSRGVRREFCPRCGATVFWRDRWRPELVDVSVGLLAAGEGARAGTWLDWWTERVSFAEDADNGRTGETARRAKGLVSSLEEGLGQWGQRESEER